MNIGLVTSYLVAGILLIAILMMNLKMSVSNSELTVKQLTREHINNLTQIFSYDISKIGANRTSRTPVMIVEADSNKIVFNSNIDHSADQSVEQITWRFTNDPVSNTDNLNDYILIRKTKYEDGSADSIQIKSGVTYFNLRYYNEYGAPRENYMPTPVTGASLNTIRQIDVQVMIQSAEKVAINLNSPGNYIRSVWEKRFSPPNLQN